jgi:DNA-directed RNA polymerase specialized sigma24 family protein
MHRTIASKTGGYNVELTPAEEAETKAEWAKNAAEQAAAEAAQQALDKLADEGMDELVATLPPAQAAALKRKLGV